MKSLFYIGLLGLLLFEVAAVYFIMPFPGSQPLNSLSLAYFLYHYRWFLRVLLVALVALGIVPAFRSKKWLPSLLLLLVGVVTYFITANLFAEAIFQQPKQLTFAGAGANPLPPNAVVIAVSYKGEAKAFPIRYIAYHHQVPVTVGGKSLLVTYCDVCRSGYVFEPVVNGQPETFRLVGMNQFNALLEDSRTHSWWRQTTGQAVAGELAGNQLPIFPTQQLSLAQFFKQYPNGQVMLPDPNYAAYYNATGTFEQGTDTDPLTRTDTASWQEKSWVVGLQVGTTARAYDWNLLKQKRLLNDTLGGRAIALVLMPDQQSFYAFERPGTDAFLLRNDSLLAPTVAVALDELFASNRLPQLPANQVFWHTWRTFHPQTTRYSGN